MFREKLVKILEKYLDDNMIETVVDDILKSTETELTDRMFQAAFDLGPVAYMILDNDFTVLEENQLSKYMIGNQIGRDLTSLMTDESHDLFQHYKIKVLKSSFSLPIHLHLKVAGEHKYIKMMTKRIDVDHLQCAMIDESFEKEALSELEVLTFKDHLTGLYNRRFFHEEMIRMDVERNYPMGLILADVNGLKLINDAFGHFVGDQLIRETAEVLLDSCRKDDVVARIGGDEFAIILPRTEKTVISSLLERIKHDMSQRFIGDIQLSIACGFSVKSGNMDNFDHLFKRAEDAMYKDKLLSASSQRVEIINGILATLHEKHDREKNHSQHVSQLMVQLGEAMGFEGSRLAMMESAGLLHDIGKIAIDYDILELDRALKPSEMAIVEKHAEIGYRILKSTASFGDIAEIVLYHHENIDGSGYPRGLKGSEIPLESRMLNICDAYDAMISNCFYKVKMTKAEAIEELKKYAGSQFDKLLIQIFIDKVL